MIDNNSNVVMTTFNSNSHRRQIKPLPPQLPYRSQSTITERDSGFITDFIADYDHPKTKIAKLSNNDINSSLIDIDNYQSSLLSIDSNNKPQTTECRQILTKLLIESTIEQTSMYITQDDCRLFRLLPKNINNNNNGLVLILLPHGRAVRFDLLER
jgi:hypothetical protein